MSKEPLIPQQSRRRRRFIVVRFSDPTLQDLTLEVSSIPYADVTTRWLRAMVRQIRPAKTVRHRLKFIRNGQPLNAMSNLRLEQFFESAEENDKYYIHCIVGPELTTEQLQDEDALDNVGQQVDGTTPEVIGFDRLRSVGFSDEEIELLRQQFRATYGDLDTSQQPDGERADLRQLEEQWIETGATEQGAQLSSIPTANYRYNMDLLIGLMVGCLFGVFSILLLKQGELFTKRQKMAVFAGIVANVIFGMTHW
ncbi:ACR110Wp [Eremothecium gossypii ATCC 10895]|uniref:ACR110Wp n=1 Tax=Eremothecium gossypii (strain ATCC 10895 / CBS 109.51 / FGSC 9923 / NRRL Y-1056) TaxID=284811 RepID=Q75C09_EREGS|nr:ACR110Wp [Eremothecium gossypii ATCC 10895]AAS51336.1 ACR110Wp [Eremothecium gossypii ATCC 10895]AEY95628.1 FACR110Wp [Eremothecium gossypii FDAG1]